MTLFDYTQAVPSNGREIVDNARFSYGIRARSNTSDADLARGIERVVGRVVGKWDRTNRRCSIAPPQTSSTPLRERERWFVTFIDLLVAHGADEDITVVAVDRLADLFAVTYVGWWEWAARRDPVLASLGLSPDQCGARRPCGRVSAVPA